jgi:hypothetical protein
MPYNLLIFPKNVLQIEIALCQDKSLWQCTAPYVLQNLSMQEVLYLTCTGNFRFCYIWNMFPRF